MNTLRSLLRPKNARDYTIDLIRERNIKTALDIGCGKSSILQGLGLETTGADINEEALEISKKNNVHNHYWLGDILYDIQVESIPPFDVVTLYGVIEHLSKPDGTKLLYFLEKITNNILLETPNGFVPQEAVGGNIHQIHLSGWLPRDFYCRGYKVYGTTATKYFMKGYNSGLHFKSKLFLYMSELLTLALQINANPKHAFNLVAIKTL